jgi:DNA-binding transcriptional ArsR family regulator
MRDVLKIATALSDEGRLRTLVALRRGELCICQITELLGLAASTVSRHISVLRDAGLVESRKAGRWIYCRLAGEEAPAAVRQAVQWATDHLADDPRSHEDHRRLEAILKLSPEELCKRQASDRSSRCCSSAPETPAAARWPKVGPEPSRVT